MQQLLICSYSLGHMVVQLVLDGKTHSQTHVNKNQIKPWSFIKDGELCSQPATICLVVLIEWTGLI